MTGKLGNTNNTAFNDADLLKGFAENQTTCEDVCAEKKRHQPSSQAILLLQVIIIRLIISAATDLTKAIKKN